MRASGVWVGRASSIGDRIAAKSDWLIAVLLVATAAILLAAGRSAICPCGTVSLWHGAVQSDQNSQQIADWYSLSHVVHGLLFYGATWLALRRWSWTARMVVAVAIEGGWEILENSPLIIDRYRSVTMAWGYSGDSVLNSVSDIGCMMIGFATAQRLPWWACAGLVVLLEVVALVAIRDNLTLNLIMLIAPVEAIRIWQAG
jgi:hypothetical protein